MPESGQLRIYRIADFGHTMLSISKIGAAEFMGIECGWHDNVPFQSCIPAGEYLLIPHEGPKFRDTFAFVNENLGVSHEHKSDIQRYACVIHHARTARGLTGCLACGASVRMDYGYPVLVESASSVAHVLSVLRWPGNRTAIIEDRLGGWTDE